MGYTDKKIDRLALSKDFPHSLDLKIFLANDTYDRYTIYSHSIEKTDEFRERMLETIKYYDDIIEVNIRFRRKDKVTEFYKYSKDDLTKEQIEDISKNMEVKSEHKISIEDWQLAKKYFVVVKEHNYAVNEYTEHDLLYSILSNL